MNGIKVFLAIAVVASDGLSGFEQQTEPVKLVAETNHSTILFTVPISSGLTRITGKFNKFSIDIDLVDNDITKSRISSTIDVSSINTGIPGRDADLLTKDFFEVEKYPEIIFTSESIKKTESGYVAEGKLQMHGVTKTVAIPFRITGTSGETVIGFSARYSLQRSDFGVATEWKHTTDDNFIGDEIGIEIDFWTKKPRKK
jgi:polyisoprenoid-binding protein YceI